MDKLAMIPEFVRPIKTILLLVFAIWLGIGIFTFMLIYNTPGFTLGKPVAKVSFLAMVAGLVLCVGVFLTEVTYIITARDLLSLTAIDLLLHASWLRLFAGLPLCLRQEGKLYSAGVFPLLPLPSFLFCLYFPQTVQ